MHSMQYFLSSFFISTVLHIFCIHAETYGIYRSSCRRDGIFKATDKGKILTGAGGKLISSMLVTSLSICARGCISTPLCLSINYNKNLPSDQNTNCQLMSINKNSPDAIILAVVGWVHYEPITQIGPRCRLGTCDPGYKCTETCKIPTGYQCIDIDECASNPCQNSGTCTDGINKYTCSCAAGYAGTKCDKTYKSCKEIYDDKPDSASGVYDLRSGKHFCVMNNLQGCCQGGWTLAMKIDGAKMTFRSVSSYWTADNIYNVEMGLKSFDSEEAKFAGFNTIGFTTICLGMKSSGVTRWTGISRTESSLVQIFRTQRYQPTNLGKSTWLGLVSGGSLQQNCNREGFNVRTDSNEMLVRIGIIGNNENDCASPDSFVGFGSEFHITCGTSRVPTMGYILIQ